ncbi:hypothetical protein ABEY57_28080 [Bacillus tropicus]
MDRYDDGSGTLERRKKKEERRKKKEEKRKKKEERRKGHSSNIKT